MTKWFALHLLKRATRIALIKFKTQIKSDEFLNTFDVQCKKYGKPRTILSDQGTCYTAKKTQKSL